MVGRPRKLSVEASLDRALELFWRQGYAETSMSDLTAALGVGPSSIYRTFGSKLGLYEAALERYVTANGGSVLGPLDAADLTVAVRGCLEAAAERYSRPDCPGGCAVLNASPGPDAECRPLVEALQSGSVDRIRARMQEAADAGQLPAGTTVEAATRYLFAALQGLSLQARTGASRELLLDVARLAARPFVTAESRTG
jgi:AcrR family transcriptional regulator